MQTRVYVLVRANKLVDGSGHYDRELTAAMARDDDDLWSCSLHVPELLATGLAGYYRVMARQPWRAGS